MATTVRKRKQKRSSLQRPEQWLVNALGAAKDVSGESVSETSAMSLSVYYDCIRVLSEDVAKLPLLLYRRLDRGKERFAGHPLYRLLHDEPCPESSAFALRETLTAHALGWGNGYAEIQRDGSGRVVALWPIDPSTVTVERSDAGQLQYVVRNEVGDKTTLRPDSILHIHGLGFSGLVGYSVARVARSSLGSAIATQKHASAFFGNGASPGGVLQHPGALSDKALTHLRESWAERHGGAENAHRPAILEEGMTWHAMSIPPEDSQLLETRQWQVEDICRWFRVPPHKVGHLLRATGWSTLEQTNADYLTDSLMPWLVRWEQEISRKLIAPQERESLFVEHLVDALLRTDTNSRFAAYAVAVTNGWMSRNEVRERENLNPAPDLDEFLMPSGAQTIAQAEAAASAPEPEPEPEAEAGDSARMIRQIAEAHKPLLTNVFDRLRRTENDKLERAANRGEGPAFVDKLFSDGEPIVTAALMPTVCSFARSAEVACAPIDDLTIEEHVRRMASRWASIRKECVKVGGPEFDVDDEVLRLYTLASRN
jgi:HK97 family phage portal protein